MRSLSFRGGSAIRLVSPLILLAFAFSASATIVDLTTAGAQQCVGDFCFQQVAPQSTGTGVIDPFLRVQANTYEQGFNTSLSNPIGMDDKAGIWTHALLVSAIPVVTFNGDQYLQFLLDINESTGSTNNLLSMGKVTLFTAPADTNTYTGSSPNITPTGATQIASFGNESTDYVKLNFDLNPGSGAGDMFMYVKASLFAGLGGQNLILYSTFGKPGTGGLDTSDGFEEWARIGSSTVVPEPASIMLMGTMLAGVGIWLRRRVEHKV